MLQSILKRYPTLNPEDVRLQDDGDGIYIAYWNSDEPKPTMEQVYQWVEEDSKFPKPKTEIEMLQQENKELKEYIEVIQLALDELLLGGM